MLELRAGLRQETVAELMQRIKTRLRQDQGSEIRAGYRQEKRARMR
jgi:hypothetical protein